MTIIINTEPAADYIKTHGWTQGTMERAGAVCLTGALRACSPQPGDWLIARAVYRAQGHAENWNDDADRAEAEVTKYLRTHPVTDDDLAATFGPNWETVVRLIRRVTAMTQPEVAARVAARGAAGDAACAIVVRDLITEDHYQTLTAPIRAAIGSDWDTATRNTK